MATLKTKANGAEDIVEVHGWGWGADVPLEQYSAIREEADQVLDSLEPGTILTAVDLLRPGRPPEDTDLDDFAAEWCVDTMVSNGELNLRRVSSRFVYPSYYEVR